MTSRRTVWVLVSAGICGLLAATPVSAQCDLQRPIRIVVDRPAGVPHDLLARALSERLSAGLKQTVIVENRVGAGGNLAAEAVARAAPDGCTWLVSLDTTLTVNPALYKNLPFDPRKDLRPLSIIATSSNMLVVHPSIPAHSVSEFVIYAKANPVTYAHGGNGSPGHLTMELFRAKAGFAATPVPYRGNTQLAADLAAGQIKVGFVSTAGVIEHVRAGRLRGLAVSAARRVAIAPEIPTIAEAGYDFERETYFVISVPAGTPEPIVATIEREARGALQATDVIERFRKMNIEIVAASASETKARLEADSRTWAGAIEATGMRAD